MPSRARGFANSDGSYGRGDGRDRGDIDPYSTRGGRADRERRRVRSSGPVNFSGSRVTRRPAGGSSRPERGRRPKRGRRKGAITGLFGALAGILTVVALIVQGTLSVVLALVGWGLTALTGYIEYRNDLAKVHRSGKPITKGTQGGPGAPPTRRRAPSRSSGSGKPSGATATTTRRRACDRRCQQSVKPVSTCRCSCNGSQHGSRAAGGAA